MNMLNFGFEWPSFYSISGRFRSARWKRILPRQGRGQVRGIRAGTGEDGAYRLFVDDKLAVEQLESRDRSGQLRAPRPPAGPIKFA